MMLLNNVLSFSIQILDFTTNIDDVHKILFHVSSLTFKDTHFDDMIIIVINNLAMKQTS